jgi:hypothetical protein
VSAAVRCQTLFFASRPAKALTGAFGSRTKVSDTVLPRSRPTERAPGARSLGGVASAHFPLHSAHSDSSTLSGGAHARSPPRHPVCPRHRRPRT